MVLPLARGLLPQAAAFVPPFLAFIGAKLVLHWAHEVWPAVPDVPTPLSLGVIVVVLGVVTLTSLRAQRSKAVSRE